MGVHQENISGQNDRIKLNFLILRAMRSENIIENCQKPKEKDLSIFKILLEGYLIFLTACGSSNFKFGLTLGVSQESN